MISGIPKRCIDVVGSLAALVLLSPLIVAIAISVRLAVGSPVIFRVRTA